MRCLDATHALLLAEASIVMAADAIAAILIFGIYLRNRRKSALTFSLAWIFDLFLVLSTLQQNQMIQMLGLVSLSVFSGLIFYGSVKFLEEESLSVQHRILSLFGVMPVAFMVYILGVYFYTGDPLWTATSATALGISGVFVVAGGILLMEVEEIYKSAVKYLYIGVILFGIHLVPAALFGKNEWYMPIGFTASTILIIFMVWAMVKLTSSERFQPPRNGSVQKKMDIKPGVMVIHPEDYRKIREKLRDMPVLAFVRNVSDVPEKWEAYFVTTIPFQGGFKNTINPTNLAKMTELSYQYLESFAQSGKQGVIVIDCFEYLTVYNQWESLMKFLSKLRDFVMMNRGTLIVVVEKDSLEPRKYSQLRKLLE
ncbi:DUF835 domain-containing protein [Thermococcus siculi]|uniref:DUF835 domain-containing protein n=1 Tax=Thermococcus siculi TaxID=72803 RepID=UPI001E35FDD0|nr:DUF835 domain-containing protein [Thermococcus siculi]